MTINTELHVEVIDSVDLTKTEVIILKYICMGWLKPKIATVLHKAYKTIDGHDENIRQKLRAKSNNEVIAIAVANGLVKITKASKALGIIFFVGTLMLGHDDARAEHKRRSKLAPKITTTISRVHLS